MGGYLSLSMFGLMMRLYISLGPPKAANIPSFNFGARLIRRVRKEGPEEIKIQISWGKRKAR